MGLQENPVLVPSTALQWPVEGFAGNTLFPKEIRNFSLGRKLCHVAVLMPSELDDI